MSVPRSVPIGAVCLLYAAVPGAVPLSGPSPKAVELPTSPLLHAAPRRIREASPDLRVAQADSGCMRNPVSARSADIHRCITKLSLFPGAFA
jgi:cobalt-zinc-cadmium efflux system outer membrane protein